MKLTKRILSIVLSVIMVISCMSCIAFAENTEKKTVKILVNGFGSGPIYDANTGESIFPPSPERLASAIIPIVPYLLTAVKNHNFTEFIDPFSEAALKALEGFIIDTDGKSRIDSVLGFQIPSDEEIIELANNDDNTDFINYRYDYRLNVQTLATDLHTFIEHILDISEAEAVELIGFSMGSCVVMSYLKLFDYEYINGVVILAGAYNGVSACGQPFARKVKLDSDATVRFVDAILGKDATAELVSALLHYLNAVGILDKVVDIGMESVEQLEDVVYEKIFKEVFTLCPGMWSLVPLEYYEEAREILVDDRYSEEYIQSIDWFHYEVQAKNEEIINGLLERGLNFGIIAKYGYPNTPCIEDINSMSDSVIDTRYESFGATCADVTGDLGENYVQKIDNGHNCVSPDNLIDASTAKYCEYTWFVKNAKHSANHELDYIPEINLSCYILNADHQVNVWESQENPQFLILIDNEFYPLTSENDSSLYQADMSKETTWSTFFNIFKKFFAVIKDFISKLFK